MPRKKKNTARFNAEGGTILQSGQQADIIVSSGTESAPRLYTPDPDRAQLVQSMLEMFSHLDSEVVYMVLSECDFKADVAMDSLLELAKEAEGICVSPNPSGFELAAAALCHPRNEAVGEDKNSEMPLYLALDTDDSAGMYLTEEFDSLLDNEFEKSFNSSQNISLNRNSEIDQQLPELIQISLRNDVLKTQSKPAISRTNCETLSSTLESSCSQNVTSLGCHLNKLKLTDFSHLVGNEEHMDNTPVCKDNTNLGPQCKNESSKVFANNSSCQRSPKHCPPLGMDRPIHEQQITTCNAVHTVGSGPAEVVVQSSVGFTDANRATEPKKFCQLPQTAWNMNAPEFYPSSEGYTFVMPVVLNPTLWRPIPHPAHQVSTVPVAPTWKRCSQNSPAQFSSQQPVFELAKKSAFGGHRLVILRGVPGSGKSTLARHILEQNPGGIILSTDDYFSSGGQYSFDGALLEEAHEWNHKRAKEAFKKDLSPIIIDNTNTQGWEMKPYVTLAIHYKYKIIFREPDTWWKHKPRELERRTKHGVRKEALKKMLERYEHYVTVQSIMESCYKKRVAEENKDCHLIQEEVINLPLKPDILEDQHSRTPPAAGNLSTEFSPDVQKGDQYATSENVACKIKPGQFLPSNDTTQVGDVFFSAASVEHVGGLNCKEMKKTLHISDSNNEMVENDAESVLSESTLMSAGDRTPVPFCQSIGQRVRRSRQRNSEVENKNQEDTKVMNAQNFTQPSEKCNLWVEHTIQKNQNYQELLIFKDDWPIDQSREQRMQKLGRRKRSELSAEKLNSDTEKMREKKYHMNSEMQKLMNMLEIVPKIAASQDTGSQNLDSVDDEGFTVDTVVESDDGLGNSQSFASLNPKEYEKQAELSYIVENISSIPISENGYLEAIKSKSPEDTFLGDYSISNVYATSMINADKQTSGTETEEVNCSVDQLISNNSQFVVNEDDQYDIQNNQHQKNKQVRRSGKQCKLALTFAKKTPVSPETCGDSPQTPLFSEVTMKDSALCSPESEEVQPIRVSQTYQTASQLGEVAFSSLKSRRDDVTMLEAQMGSLATIVQCQDPTPDIVASNASMSHWIDGYISPLVQTPDENEQIPQTTTRFSSLSPCLDELIPETVDSASWSADLNEAVSVDITGSASYLPETDVYIETKTDSMLKLYNADEGITNVTLWCSLNSQENDPVIETSEAESTCQLDDLVSKNVISSSETCQFNEVFSQTEKSFVNCDELNKNEGNFVSKSAQSNSGNLDFTCFHNSPLNQQSDLPSSSGSYKTDENIFEIKEYSATVSPQLCEVSHVTTISCSSKLSQLNEATKAAINCNFGPPLIEDALTEGEVSYLCDSSQPVIQDITVSSTTESSHLAISEIIESSAPEWPKSDKAPAEMIIKSQYKFSTLPEVTTNTVTVFPSVETPPSNEVGTEIVKNPPSLSPQSDEVISEYIVASTSESAYFEKISSVDHIIRDSVKKKISAVSTQTAPEDFTLVWRVEKETVDTSGVKVLMGNKDNFKPKILDSVLLVSCLQVPYRAVYEKSTQVEESEFKNKDKVRNLHILKQHFKLVSYDILEDLYEKCNNDLDWTINLLLDSGEKFYKEDVEDSTEFSGLKEKIFVDHTPHDLNSKELLNIGISGEKHVENTEAVINDPWCYHQKEFYCDYLEIKYDSNPAVNSSCCLEEMCNRSELNIVPLQPQVFQQPHIQDRDLVLSNNLQLHEQLHKDKGLNELKGDLKAAISQQNTLTGLNNSSLLNSSECREKLELSSTSTEMQKQNRTKQSNGKKMEPLHIKTLELCLPPELAFQLSDLFGPVGIDPDMLSIEDCIVQIDLNLAKLIHQKWKDSLQERQRQEALSYHLLEENSAYPNNHQLDEVNKASWAFTGFEGAKESRQWELPYMNHWTTRISHVSLRDIMSEEMALEEHIKAKDVPFLGRRDGAVMLKEKQLFKMFPSIDQHFLLDIFKDNNYSLEQTEHFLKSLLDEEPAKTVVAKNVIQRTELPRPQNKEKLKKQKDAEENDESRLYQDTVDPDYDDYRAEAFIHRLKQQECFSKAAEAYRRGMKDVATYYAQQGHLHGQHMKDAHYRAAIKIFERVNASLLPQNVLDLHGLHVDEAIHHLRRVIQEKQTEYQQCGGKPHLSVITGRGNHSQGGVARIRPAVIDYLTNHSFRFSEPKPGVLNIMLR
ncbi:NEDD4-binding protein 2 [Erpetoichthys calabaricus]|uniref:NEDD4 binding protein 2 n=1 Tax=Erpetoichthys calabaricus TaxID=27687 RepID=A0A8C4RU32_ERPCA|nr:NEDD4-binding protein 2 [Erpetoichthys calabaricus]